MHSFIILCELRNIAILFIDKKNIDQLGISGYFNPSLQVPSNRGTNFQITFRNYFK